MRVRDALLAALPDWYDPYFFQGKTVVQTCMEGQRSEVVGAALLAARATPGA